LEEFIVILIEFNVPEVAQDHPAKIPVSDGIALNVTTNTTVKWSICR
jgi:hypothetical protein